MIFLPFLQNLLSHLTPTRSNLSEGRAGVWYCRMGNNGCWEALGPVQQRFGQISKEIKECLKECGPPDDAIVTWSLYMIGRTQETAVPTILICSSKKKARKAARGLIEENRILDEWVSLGFNIGDCSIPPDHYRMPGSQDTLQMLAGDENISKTNLAGLKLAECPVWCKSASIEAGMKVFFQPTSDSNARRHATIGSIFASNGKYYATTTGHLVADEVYPYQDADDTVEFEFDIAGDEKQEITSDFLIDLNGPAEACDLESYRVRNAGQLARNMDWKAQNRIQLSRAVPAQEMVSDKTMEESAKSLEGRHTQESDLIRLGQVVFASSKGRNPNLDYAVIEIDKIHAACADRWKQEVISRFGMAHKISRTAEVEAITGSRGLTKGQLSATPSFIRFPYGSDFQEVWTVHFDQPLSKGDCGSMVVDPKTRQLCGHIVAGSPLSGVAYIVPAHEMFDDIGKILGLRLEPAVSNPKDKKHLQVLAPDNPVAECTWVEDRCRDSTGYHRLQLVDPMNTGGFEWRVWFVAASGFFAASYSLFATNAVIPLLGVLFSSSETTIRSLGLVLNVSALCGSIIGQLVFGVTADIYGRRAMYGLELALIIFGTLGMAQASTTGISVASWLVFWRFITGIGIGGGYPLSAVITAEFAPRRHQATMLAAVSLAQPLGQLAVDLVSTIVARQALKMDPLGADMRWNDVRGIVDFTWRFIVGVGIVPALIALVFRFNIPETPRYIIDVRDDPGQARDAVLTLVDDNRIKATPSHETPRISRMSKMSPQSLEELQPRKNALAKSKAFRLGFSDFMWNQGNWRYLAATSMCWLLFDFAFYGIGLNDPSAPAEAWSPTGFEEIWAAQSSKTNRIELFTVISLAHQHASLSLVVPTLGALIGCCALYFSINHLGRRKLQGLGFLGLFATLLALGAVFLLSSEGSYRAIAPFLLFLCRVFFTLGPNSTTFMIPAEIFPTRYRGTAYGMSAAIGKIGSITAQLVFEKMMSATAAPASFLPAGAGRVLLLVSALMLLGAFITWQWVPEPQSNGRPKTIFGKWTSTALNNWCWGPRGQERERDRHEIRECGDGD